MRTLMIATLAITGLGLSGCSQISSLWKKSDKADTLAHSDTSLRTTPQQDYQFDGQTYDVEIYDSASQYGTSQYAGYAVELYDSQPSYSAAAYSDPRQSEFIKLNGQSETIDWQNCETRHRGYLFLSEYNFSLNPGFEVCMRNKGYVLSTEYGPASKPTLSAQTAGLRGSLPAPTYGGYPQPRYETSSSAFFP